MKNLSKIVVLVVIFIVALSCKKEKLQVQVKPTTTINNQIPFLGTWSRSFSMGKDVSAQVTYTIYQDSIQYEMIGPMTMKYTLIKDVFSSKDNRWIGKRNGTPYAIFVKNITKEAITVLKMKVGSKEKGLTMAFPSDSARSKFSSWNTYTKK